MRNIPLSSIKATISKAEETAPENKIKTWQKKITVKTIVPRGELKLMVTGMKKNLNLSVIMVLIK
jgi:hypothetical protein